MDNELTKEEAERLAQAVARRMLNTPPKPRTKPKPATTPTREQASKPGKRGQAGAAS